MGDYDYYRTRYGLMPTLGGRRRAVYDSEANAPPRGGPTIFDLENQENERGRSQREAMGEYGEMLAPDVAREQGISPDEARSQLTGGTVGPEGPIHFWGRQVSKLWGAGQAPEGEEQGVRVARMKGMLERRAMDAQDRGEQQKMAAQLYGMRGGVDDPSALGEPTLSALRGGGAKDLPEHMKLKAPDAASLVGLYQRDPKSAEELAGIIYGGKNGGSAGGKIPAGVALANALADARKRGDKNMERSILDLQGKGANPGPAPEQKEFDDFIHSSDTQEQLAQEAAEADDLKKKGGKPQEGPYTRRRRMLFDAAQRARAANTRSQLYDQPDDGGDDDDPTGDKFLDAELGGGGGEGEPSLSGRPGRVR